MSDFRAIGGVSATLQALIQDRLELPDGVNQAGDVSVTIGPPAFSARDTDPHLEDPRINLFLYRVQGNGRLQNQEIPGRGSSSGYGYPPLSLTLHYLITTYGNQESNTTPLLFDDTLAQFLLGGVMRVLHDVPVVTETITTLRVPSGRVVLHESLRGEFDQVKLTLEPLTLEDISKVWTALGLRYRLSAAYTIDVVQIESRRPRRFPRPVGQPIPPDRFPLPTDPPSPGPMVYVHTIQPPTITELRVRRQGETIEMPFPYAAIGDTLILRGTSLAGQVTSVAFGEIEVPAAVASGDRVEAEIPNAVIPANGAIASERQLQPGVRSVQVVVRDPLVPHSGHSSNEAVFMLVPRVHPATILYSAGPPRVIRIQGSRLFTRPAASLTIIGRSAVPHAAYLSATPTQLVVPIPEHLPSRGVSVFVSAPLPDPIPIQASAQTLDITIGGVTKQVTANLPASLPRAAAPGILATLIRDAVPTNPRFTGARVDLWEDRMVIVPGGLIDAITFGSPAPLTFAADLGLTAAQPPGAASVLLSGALASPPSLSSPSPRLTVTIGAAPPVTVGVAPSTSLVLLAASLQAALRAASAAPEYAHAGVMTSGTQLLVIPGVAAPVAFAAAPGDDTTVAELQLRARFAVRVRVNEAESIDAAFVELPQ